MREMKLLFFPPNIIIGNVYSLKQVPFSIDYEWVPVEALKAAGDAVGQAQFIAAAVQLIDNLQPGHAVAYGS